jgi:hypothetical protein
VQKERRKENLAIADESKPHVGIALQPLWEAENEWLWMCVCV